MFNFDLRSKCDAVCCGDPVHLMINRKKIQLVQVQLSMWDIILLIRYNTTELIAENRQETFWLRLDAQPKIDKKSSGSG